MSRASQHWSAAKRQFLIFSLVGAFVAPMFTSAMPARAPIPAQRCQGALQEDAATRTISLTANCTTDRAITVADGWTLDGEAHTIFVKDPVGSRLRGGVIDVRGGTVTVRNVTVDGSALTPGCSPETAVAGVLFLGAAGVIEGATFTSIARGAGYRCGYGIVVAEPGPAPVTISHNSIHGPGDGGVFVTGAAAEVTGNTISDTGGNGIAFGAPNTTGTIAGNTIRNAGYAGISVEDSATATVSGNTISDAAGFGIIAITGASVEVISQNRISGGPAGMVISDPGTRVTLDGNEIVGTSKDGIYIQNGAEAMVTTNVIAPTSGNGITVSQKGTRGTIRENTIEATGKFGILVSGGARAETTGNIVRGPGSLSVESLFGPFGIRYGDGTSGAIRENSVSGYLSDDPGSRACGIAIDLLAGAVQLGENAFPPPGNTSNFCNGTTPDGWNIPKPGATPAATPAS